MYGNDGSFYPKDVKQRDLVDQKLFFDTFLFNRLRSITYAALAQGVRKPPSKLLKELRDACGFLEAFLSKSKFVAGDTMTLADISIVATVSAMRYVITIDVSKYPNITAWFRNMEKQPFFQKCLAPGSEKLRKHLKVSLDL